MSTQKDEQIESWLNQINELLKESSRTKQQKEMDVDTLEELIKDRLDDSNLNFTDEYIEDVMSRLTDLRGLDSLPK
jgi:3-hydroxyacyl-CoA dehydrogenase